MRGDIFGKVGDSRYVIMNIPGMIRVTYDVVFGVFSYGEPLIMYGTPGLRKLSEVEFQYPRDPQIMAIAPNASGDLERAIKESLIQYSINDIN